jgi:hypothetical protein
MDPTEDTEAAVVFVVPVELVALVVTLAEVDEVKSEADVDGNEVLEASKVVEVPSDAVVATPAVAASVVETPTCPVVISPVVASPVVPVVPVVAGGATHSPRSDPEGGRTCRLFRKRSKVFTCHANGCTCAWTVSNLVKYSRIEC